MDTTINHDHKNYRFHLLKTSNGNDEATNNPLAELQYKLKDKELWVVHCGTRSDARGQGLASRLMIAAVEYAREHQLTIVPICSYAAYAFRKNAPQWDDVLASKS